MAVDDELSLDFDQIVDLAAARLRADYAEHPDPARLIAEPFTVAALRETQQVIAGKPLRPDTFRRRMLPQLIATGAALRGRVGKPAALFNRLTGPTISGEPTGGRLAPNQ